ncbi:MAG: hypothetical protein LBC56_02540 [Oscillospiraceae bacterium]|jgi:hypothetical protein|nr:hypothetical protein [Oscillospiraceae bacterium]
MYSKKIYAAGTAAFLLVFFILAAGSAFLSQDGAEIVDDCGDISPGSNIAAYNNMIVRNFETCPDSTQLAVANGFIRTGEVVYSVSQPVSITVNFYASTYITERLEENIPYSDMELGVFIYAGSAHIQESISYGGAGFDGRIYYRLDADLPAEASQVSIKIITADPDDEINLRILLANVKIIQTSRSSEIAAPLLSSEPLSSGSSSQAPAPPASSREPEEKPPQNSSSSNIVSKPPPLPSLSVSSPLSGSETEKTPTVPNSEGSNEGKAVNGGEVSHGSADPYAKRKDPNTAFTSGIGDAESVDLQIPETPKGLETIIIQNVARKPPEQSAGEPKEEFSSPPIFSSSQEESVPAVSVVIAEDEKTPPFAVLFAALGISAAAIAASLVLKKLLK